jgi:hypothetical protein
MADGTFRTEQYEAFGSLLPGRNYSSPARKYSRPTMMCVCEQRPVKASRFCGHVMV